jgi:hypothetical protein
MAEDIEGSTGGESIVNPMQTAGCAEETSKTHKDLCFSFADHLQEAK